MKLIRHTFLLGVLVAVPALAMAQTPAVKPAPAPETKAAAPAQPPAKDAAVKTPAVKAKAAKAQAIHATKGVVKSVDDKMLVLTTTGTKGKDLTFVLDSTTAKTGTPVVGATVEVRYKTEGKQNIATAVTVSEPKKQK